MRSGDDEQQDGMDMIYSTKKVEQFNNNSF